MYLCVRVCVCVCVCEQKFRQNADLRRDETSLAFDFWHVAWGKGLQHICRRFFFSARTPRYLNMAVSVKFRLKIAVGAEKCVKKNDFY